MANDTVQLTVEDQVATVRLNQPEKSNPLNTASATGLKAAFDDIADRDVRCVVIEGTGAAFSAGGDVSVMQEDLDPDRSPARRLETIEHVSGAVRTVGECPVPVVAKIDGPAVGAGASLAVACDVQVASDRSSVGFVFRNVGLTLDSATSYYLTRLVGLNIAKDLLFRGEILGAEEAADLGLLTHVYPTADFDERAQEYVREIATGPTVALEQSKRLLDSARGKSLKETWADEALAQNQVVESDDFQEGVNAFLESREPEFDGV
jgi:enoyl-CoA hydratase/carnithine racemase